MNIATTVAVVEDNPEICEELRHIIRKAPDLSCVCVCRNARSALDLLPRHAPDVVLMDIQLPDAPGIECTARLKPRMRDTQFLMFTIHDDSDQIFRALEAGAIGYLLKTAEPAEILDAIREAKNGGAPMTREVARRVVELFHTSTSARSNEVSCLTDREREVLEHLAEGRIDKQIAELLGISLQTVNSHLKHIYRKLRVHSRTEAVIKFLR